MNTQIFADLAKIIAERKKNPTDESYTASLFKGGENKIIKKLGEENAEYIRALICGSDENIAEEAADYIYHMMVSLEYRDVGFAKVADELARRFKG